MQTSMGVLIYNTLVVALDTGKATSYGKKTNRVIFMCTFPGCYIVFHRVFSFR